MDDTTRMILRDLAKHRSRNTIITELSEYSGLRWEEAESLVHRIDTEYAREIHLRQKPFYFLLGGAIALGGFLLSGFMAFATFNGLVFLLLWLPIPYLGNAFFFILGILALIGGVRGVIRILRD